jgi:NAD(P)-dependent dehydrogenase (short-subunit alcohol dehydrogenase family)
MSQFAGQLALVTGASRGIGAATAEALAAAGAHVVLTARDAKALEAVEERIFAAGGQATIAPVDLAENDGIVRLAAAISGRWPALDILVHAAAIMPQLTPVGDIDQGSFSKALTANVLATQALIGAFGPLLKTSADARLVYLTSSVATEPRAYWGAYAACKAAAEVLVDCYAQEVRNIAPTPVKIRNRSNRLRPWRRVWLPCLVNNLPVRTANGLTSPHNTRATSIGDTLQSLPRNPQVIVQQRGKQR